MIVPSPLYFDARTGEPHLRPQRRRKGIQLGNGPNGGDIIAVPDGLTAEQCATALGIKLKPRHRKPPPGYRRPRKPT